MLAFFGTFGRTSDLSWMGSRSEPPISYQSPRSLQNSEEMTGMSNPKDFLARRYGPGPTAEIARFFTS